MPYQPAVSLKEAELLLQSHWGNFIEDGEVPLVDISDLTAGTVWSYLLTLPWTANGEQLQDVIDQYDCPQEWGPEIKGDPRFMFVQRLKKHSPLEAVALHLAICEWWEARGAADRDLDFRDIPELALNHFFNIQG
jgi:hypothetical protein